MTVLVTGAGSYIARAIIRRLREQKATVLATYRTRRPIDLDGVRLFQLDLRHPSAFSNLPRTVDAIVHVAAATPRHTANEIIDSAAQGLLALQEYALDSDAGALVFTSSVSIHGRIDSSVLDETTPILEPDVYGASKLLVERGLATIADRIPVLALRLPSVLGRLETESWIPSLLRRLLANEEVFVFNPRAAFNNAIDVDELARFIVSSVTQPFTGFHAFPMASSGSMTIAEVLDLLRSSVKSHSIVSFDKPSRSSFTISSEYAIKRLGYEPIGIRETLHRFAQRVAGRTG